MTQADRVLSTPPTNTSVHNDTTRRRFLSQAAVVAAGGAVAGMTNPLPVAAQASVRVPDPILAAIESHKAAVIVTNATQRRYSAFENELAEHERLQPSRRTDDDNRRDDALGTARNDAFDAEREIAYDILDIRPTTLVGVAALLAYVATMTRKSTHGLAGRFAGWDVSGGPNYRPGQDPARVASGDGVMADYIQDNALDYFCHGIARIETLGPCRRVIFTIPSLESPGHQQVAVKLIITAELLATLSYLAAGADQRGGISPALLALETERAN